MCVFCVCSMCEQNRRSSIWSVERPKYSINADTNKTFREWSYCANSCYPIYLIYHRVYCNFCVVLCPKFALTSAHWGLKHIGNFCMFLTGALLWTSQKSRKRLSYTYLFHIMLVHSSQTPEFVCTEVVGLNSVMKIICPLSAIISTFSDFQKPVLPIFKVYYSPMLNQ